MSHTNSTSNYGLPQWVGTDKPTFLGDFNSAFYDIDAQMKTNSDAAASATTTANTAASAAATASTNATTALNTANSAASEAASATSAAASATATADTAATNAATALRASQANNIANLAPAYDPTLTYDVGDLVTYVDTETNTGKLYKCIVAIASPMAFNLNYWDDVTTSEVYLPYGIVIGEFTANGTSDTWGNVLNALGTARSSFNKPAENYRFSLIETNPDYISTWHERALYGTDLKQIAMCDTNVGSSNLRITQVLIDGVNGASSYMRRWTMTNTPTNTYSDLTSEVANASTYTLVAEKIK